MSGEQPCKDWRPVIAGMGISGWEIASIIQTPVIVQTSFTTYRMKLLMFFQRKLYPVKKQSIEARAKTKASTLPNSLGHAGYFGQHEVVDRAQISDFDLIYRDHDSYSMPHSLGNYGLFSGWAAESRRPSFETTRLSPGRGSFRGATGT